MRELTPFRVRVRWAALLAGVGALLLGATAASQAPAQVTLQTSICGVGNGSTWTRAGHSGTTWLVVALDDKNQCKSARQWLTQLSARLTAHSGADVQAFRLLGDACVLTKPTLIAACRTGNGGPGSVGVAVIGDPAANPAARPYTGGRTSFPALPPAGGGDTRGGPGASADGIPIPWTAGVECHYPTISNSVAWSLVLPTGKLITGTKWWVRGSTGGSAAGCNGLRDIWQKLTVKAGRQYANTESFEAKSWIDGSWSCVASHDVAAPGGGSAIASLGYAACGRIQYPGGGSHPILEWVGVLPYVEEATPATTIAERGDLNQQALSLRNSLDRYGVHAASEVALTTKRLNHVPPNAAPAAGAHPLSTNTVFTCGSTPSEHDPSYRILGAAWTHGSEHGSNWQVAVNGGYPCELARGLFLPWLADALSGGSAPTGAQLSRYGWRCALHRTTLIGTCHFTGSGEALQVAIGGPIPGNTTIGIRAAYNTGATRETLPNAVRAAS